MMGWQCHQLDHTQIICTSLPTDNHASTSSLIMVALCNRADHYIFNLFLSSFFFSSPNLSSRRLEVYHNSAHGVALARIYNAGLKCAASGSLQIQDAKNCHLGTIAQLCRAISSQLRHVSTIGKILLSSNTSSTCPDNMVNFGLLTGEICWRVWGTPTNFNRFCTASSSGRQPNFAALNRGRHLCSAG